MGVLAVAIAGIFFLVLLLAGFHREMKRNKCRGVRIAKHSRPQEATNDSENRDKPARAA